MYPLSLRCLIRFLTVSSSTPNFEAISVYDFFVFQTSGEPQSSLMRSEYALSRTDKRLQSGHFLLFPINVQKTRESLGIGLGTERTILFSSLQAGLAASQNSLLWCGLFLFKPYYA